MSGGGGWLLGRKQEERGMSCRWKRWGAGGSGG